MHIQYMVFDAPLGEIFVAESRQGLLYVGFGHKGLKGLTDVARKRYPDAQIIPSIFDAAQQVQAYLDGKRKAFKAKLDIQGTPFQQAVWNYLLEIPFGETRTYGDVARALGRPAAFRAVGGACGANPLPLVVPCHRVLASDGGLGGYGGGLDWKRWLLNLEGGAF